jgi:hypothetical protein
VDMERALLARLSNLRLEHYRHRRVDQTAYHTRIYYQVFLGDIP